MKKEFSGSWISSKQVRKQRKYRHNAPLHIRHKFMSANLSKDLRKRYTKRSLPLHKGDMVRIMRGEFKNKKGKIEIVELNNLRVFIEGMQRNKKDGTKVSVPFQPSNLQITELNLEDKERMKLLQRKNEIGKKQEAKPVAVPAKPAVKQQNMLQAPKPQALPTKKIGDNRK